MDLPLLDGELTDGVVTVRPSEHSDAAILRAGIDAAARRFLGDDAEPDPLGVVVRDGELVGWIDWDTDREWLGPREVNIGYAIGPGHRGQGSARRALALLARHLADDGVTATLLIDPANAPSIAVADRAGFERIGEVGDQLLFRLRDTRS